ncbi:NAD-dependent epimerase/dehydratase family protein [Sporosarcina sp. E16_8]|uniref:NAD-dependent epimerase/dehydratase family protein n=1 Tax=Sporosarcina sp. E16_8 TaxID=2789295 RepID=UPI001A91F11A|nr:NAD-dependent epimerase/dehydratase family protein [Sporosarcina sp. E16_8]MBO0588600.1 NAD-dependent epimerase/dehydratase family protein [Sporosarcina sp. E16_8]
MKVLVTGGAGFIGSHVVEELLNHQYEVVIVDSFVTGFPENVCVDAKLYRRDITDLELEDVFKLEKPDFVLHLAAQASVITSTNDPYLDFFTNTVGTVRVSLLSKKYNVKKIIFASTAAVYDEPSYLPIDEKHPLKQQSYYALSKYSAENFILLSGVMQDLNYCILRFSNVYGPRQNAEGEAGVISIFINRLLKNDEIYIYGGSQTRDFIYVKDVAAACHLAMVGKQKGVYNISSCTETTINQLFQLISSEMDVISIPVYKSLRVGEIVQSVLDHTKALQELEWRLHYSLVDGLKETVQYYSRNKVKHLGNFITSS